MFRHDFEEFADRRLVIFTVKVWMEFVPVSEMAKIQFWKIKNISNFAVLKNNSYLAMFVAEADILQLGALHWTLPSLSSLENNGLFSNVVSTFDLGFPRTASSKIESISSIPRFL